MTEIILRDLQQLDHWGLRNALLNPRSQIRGFTRRCCPSVRLFFRLFVRSFVCPFVCLSPVKFVKSFYRWQHLMAIEGFRILSDTLSLVDQPLNAHIKTAQQRTIVQWLVHWPLMSGLLRMVQRGGAWAGWGLLAVPNVTAHPSTASVPTSYYLTWHYNCLWTPKGNNSTSSTNYKLQQQSYKQSRINNGNYNEQTTSFTLYQRLRYAVSVIDTLSINQSTFIDITKYNHSINE